MSLPTVFTNSSGHSLAANVEFAISCKIGWLMASYAIWGRILQQKLRMIL
jgi:hypothetical protein